MGGRSWSAAAAGAVLAVLLAGCEDERPEAPGRVAPGIEEVGGRRGAEGAKGLAWARVWSLGGRQSLRAAVAPGGDILVAATYTQPLDLGGGPLPFHRERGGAHLVVARFTPDGSLRSAQGYSPRGAGRGLTEVSAVSADRGGDTLLCGTSPDGFERGDVRLPPGPFVAKLSAEGAVLWARPLPGTGPLQLGGVAADASGHVVAMGDFAGDRDFGAGRAHVRADGRGLFVARWAPDGTPVWSRTFPAPQGLVHARALALDASGGVHVAGAYGGEVNFGDSTFVTVLPQVPFALKLSRDGQHLWSRELSGAAGAASGLSVGVDRVFVTGSFEGGFHLRDVHHRSQGQAGFIAAFDSVGGEKWARTLGRSARAVATTEAGDVLVAGAHDGGVDASSAGWAPGLYVAKLAPKDGAFAWVRGLGGTGTLSASGLAVGAGEGAVLAGSLARSSGFVVRLGP